MVILYYYYYYSAFGLLRPPFTPGPLFSSFLLIFLVPLIQSHFQLLFSLARTCLSSCSSLSVLFFIGPLVLVVLPIEDLLFSFLFFFRSSSLSVPASSVLSCQAKIALSLGLISCPQLMRFKSRGPSVLAVCLGYVTEMHCSRRPWKTP